MDLSKIIIDKIISNPEIQNAILESATTGKVSKATQDTIVNIAKTLIPKNAISAANLPNAISASNLANVANVASSDSSSLFFPGIEILITLILLVWSISIIYCTFIVKDTETKENIKYTHRVLFGSLGIIPILAITWVLSYFMYVSFPDFIKSIPRIDKVIAKLLSSNI